MPFSSSNSTRLDSIVSSLARVSGFLTSSYRSSRTWGFGTESQFFTFLCDAYGMSQSPPPMSSPRAFYNDNRWAS